eukprot:889260_1
MASSEFKDEDGLWDDDFGQKVDLCRRIREILTNYPEGIAVLKELVQNADDAGASTIRFVYDTRQHPTDTLAETAFAEFQSPSILVYNNAMFSESDFKSIQSIGSSLSKKDSVNKTGRFGLGFNAVYHLTEVPAFVSSDYLIYFDPQGRYLPNINHGNPGKRINFVKQKVIHKYPNQFYPFKVFDSDMVHTFKGTLFRLPLRTQPQSGNSELSSKYYTHSDIDLMYKALITEGDNFLLFLKSIARLEWYEWSDIHSTQPTLCYRVSIEGQLNKQQIELRTCINTIQKASQLTWTQCDSFKFETYIRNESKYDSYHSEWIVCNALGGGSNQASQIAMSHPNLKLLPYGGVAARISSNVPWQTVFHGKAYCFLSLPLTNGLPIHTNGYFEMSQNRRNLWWGGQQEEDKVAMTGSGSLRYFWNLCLLQDVITRCYIQVIDYAKQLCIANKMDIATFYKLWPHQIPGTKGDPFEVLTREVLTIICDSRRFLHCKQNGGSWLKCSESVVCNLDEFELEIYTILDRIGLPIVEIPKRVHYVLQDASSTCTPPVTLSSSYVREYIRQQITNNIDPATNILCKVNRLDMPSKALLSQYLLSDLTQLKPPQLTDASDFPQCCHMLPILPTFAVSKDDHSSLRTFWCHDQMEREIAQQIFGSHCQEYTQSIYYSSDKALVDILSATNNKQICPVLVNINHLSPPILRILSHKRFSLNTNLVDISDNYPLWTKFLTIIFQCQRKRPTFINNKRFHFQFISDKDAHQIWSDLIHNIWKYIVRKQIPYKYYESAPIVAAHNHSRSEHYLCLPSPSTWLIKPLTKTNTEVSKECHLVFQLLTEHSPCVLLDTAIINLEDAAVAHRILSKNKCIYSCEALNDVIRLLSILPSTVFTEWRQNMDKLTTHLRALRRYLLVSNINWNASSQAIKKLLKSLPIYDVHCDENVDENDAYTLSDLTSSTKYIPPPVTNIHCSLLSSQFIYISKEDKAGGYHRFLHALNIQTMPVTAFYKTYFFKRLSTWDDTVRNSTIIDILQIIKRNEFTSEDDGYKLIEMIKATNCIPTRDNTLKRVSNLYDPSIRELQSILDANKHFPNAMFCDMLPTLRELGLNTQLNRDTILLSVTSNIPYLYKTLFYQLFGDTVHKMKGSDSNSSSQSNSFFSSALNFMNKTKTMFDEEQKEKEAEEVKTKAKQRKDVKNILEQNAWIWINGSFYKSDRVALHDPPDSIACRPYLEIIPSSYHSFESLFVECGVRNTFEPRDYGNILNLIHNEAENKKDIHLAVQIAQYVSDHMNVMGDLLFPIPTNEDHMDYPNHLYYNDAPWINVHNHKSESKDEKENIKFVHNKLSIDVAKKLGAKSFRELFVTTNSESLSFEFNSLSFGQHESLTRRLKDILRAYPAGPSIINEFIQNADDAGATKVIIMLNEKEYATDCLLSNKLKPFQGPSLLVFNDSTFNETDFINLSRIGQGSKLQKLEATGRFGLGFNCCYHITDVPQLVSSSSIVLFDPHASHLPNVNSNAPGIRINFLRSDLVNTFPDQFAPYQDFGDIFGCSLDEAYNGTLFRFPLRNPAVAKYSEIKSEISSIQSIKKMMLSFGAFAKETLLFLRSVFCIQLKIAHKDGTVEDILNVQIKNKKQQKPSIWTTFIGSKGSKSTHAFYRYLERLNDSENALPTGVRSIQIISTSQDTERTDEYVIYEQIGGGDTVSMACKEENRELKLIPFGCVAAHVSSSSSASTLKGGRAFTFLPLPIKTGLPVHLNSYFELSANRRDLWWGLDLDNDMDSNGVAYTVKHKWNQSVLRYVLAPCYCNLIQYIAHTKVNQSLTFHQYYDLFPHKVDSQPFMELLQSFYSNISKVEVLYYPINDDEGKWLAPSKCIAFANANDNDQQNDSAERERMQSILLKCNQSVVTLEAHLMDNLIKYKSGLHPFSSMWLRTKFLLSLAPDQLSECLTYEDYIFLLKSCVEDIHANNIQQLYNLPLLPLNNGSFCKILSNKVALDKRVFFTRDQSFIHLLKTAPNASTNENNISNRVIASSDLPNSVVSKLSDKDIMRFTNICEPDHDILIELLPFLLPKHCSTQTEVLWDGTCPTKQWLNELWVALKDLHNPMESLSNLCVLPVLTYANVPQTQSYKAQTQLVTANATQHVYIDVRSLDEPLKQLLFQIGFHCINNECIANHVGLSKHILKPSLIGILQGIEKLIHVSFNGNCNTFCKTMFNANCTKNQRIALRQFMVRQMDNMQYEDSKSQQIFMRRTSNYKPLIAALPIYQVFCHKKKKSKDESKDAEDN